VKKKKQKVNMEEEAVSEEVVTETTESQEPEVNQEETSTIPEETPADKNWKEARKKMAELNRSLKERDRQLEELRNEFRNSKPKEPEEELGDNDYIQKKHLQKNLTSHEKKIAQLEAQLMQQSIKTKFTDFDDVVTDEAVEYLNEHEPELALSIKALAHDPYNQHILAYKILKRTDMSKEKNYDKNDQIIQKNLSKPTSVQAVKKTNALADANKFANGLTPELKKALFKEMNDAAKRNH
jgi:hypothetical protein